MCIDRLLKRGIRATKGRSKGCFHVMEAAARVSHASPQSKFYFRFLGASILRPIFDIEASILMEDQIELKSEAVITVSQYGVYDQVYTDL